MRFYGGRGMGSGAVCMIDSGGRQVVIGMLYVGIFAP